MGRGRGEEEGNGSVIRGRDQGFDRGAVTREIRSGDVIRGCDRVGGIGCEGGERGGDVGDHVIMVGASLRAAPSGASRLLR